MSGWWPLAFMGIALGWLLWVAALVLLLYCEGLQSGILAEPGDPCGPLRWSVIGGFLVLLGASAFALARWSDSRRRR